MPDAGASVDADDVHRELYMVASLSTYDNVFKKVCLSVV